MPLIKRREDDKSKDGLLEKGLKLFFSNTAKFANTAALAGEQVVDTARMELANRSKNSQAFRNANEASEEDYKRYADKKQGLLGAGTFFKNSKEAKSGELTTGAKRIGGGTISTAGEILPFASGGAAVAGKGASLKALAAEGAGYGVAQTAGDTLQTDTLDPKEAAINVITGGIAGPGAALAGRAAGKIGKTVGEIAADERGAIGKLGDKLDLTPKTPEQAKRVISDIAAPVKSVRDKAMEIVGDTANKTAVKTVQKNVSDVGKGAQTIAQRLDEQLGDFDKAIQAPKEVVDALSRNAELVSRNARKHDWLDQYEDTLSVLGRYHGKVGTDFGYKLAEGAKKVADVQDVTRESVQKTQKILSKISKTKSGRSEIQSRIAAALEDRENAGNYLHRPEEVQLFDEAKKVLDFFKDQRVKLGKDVVSQNYSPRSQIRNALDAPERMMQDMRSAFSPDVQSAFSKKRVLDEAADDIDRNIIDLLPRYISSQAKEFGYDDAMKYLQENLPNINPAYITSSKGRRKGEEYLRTLISQVLDPPTMSKWERRQNAALATTYRNQLGFSPRFAAQNMTQRYATKTEISKEASKLVRKMDGADLVSLREGLITGQNPITAELGNAENALLGKETGFMKKLGKIEPGQAVERGNISGAFDRGAAQAVSESDLYKNAIKQGVKPKEAAKLALKDEAVRDLAIRRGNVVINDTQFGANFVTKPEFFRKQSTFFGISDKFLKQYQRFPVGMVQNLSTIMRMKDARALDVLKRGDPRETKLVDFLYSAQSMKGGVDDLIKGIKNKEIVDVPLDVAVGYKKELGKAVNTLNKEIKGTSQLRAGKSAKNYLKMWAAASAIQFLFDGGLSKEGDDQNSAIGKATLYGAPINVPTKDRNPITQGIIAPSFPRNFDVTDPNTARKLTNFIPGVGLVVNRGRDAQKFISSLVGE